MITVTLPIEEYERLKACEKELGVLRSRDTLERSKVYQEERERNMAIIEKHQEEFKRYALGGGIKIDTTVAQEHISSIVDEAMQSTKRAGW